MTLKALVFDFDGLILDTETPLIEAYGDIFAEEGMPFDRAEFARQVGHADYAFDPWRGFRPELDRTELEERRRRRARARVGEQPLLPGVRELIEAARAEGLRLGIASNSSHEWVEPHLRRLGLHGHFHFFGCRGDAPAPKPEPDIYRLVVNSLGCRTCEALALEDSFAGVRAARRAGLWVMAIPNAATLEHDLDDAHWRIPSMDATNLADLRARIASAS